MLRVTGWCAAEEVKNFVSFFLCSLHNFSLEEVVGADVSCFSVGCTVKIYNRFRCFVKEIDASADDLAAGGFYEHESSGLVAEHVFFQGGEHRLRKNVEGFLRGRSRSDLIKLVPLFRGCFDELQVVSLSFLDSLFTV